MTVGASYAVVVSGRATREIERAHAWWRENRVDAPDAVREELAAAFELLRAEPGVGSRSRDERLQHVRRLYLHRVGYFLYYRTLDWATPTVQVVAFWHASRGRDPKI